VPSHEAGNATRAEIYEYIQRQFEVPRNLVISVRNSHRDELCLGDGDLPVQFAIELLTIEPGPPRFFLSVTHGAERPNLKIAVPVLRGNKGNVLLYRHAFKIEGIQTCSVARVLGQLYSFHHLPLDSCSFVFRDCFGFLVLIDHRAIANWKPNARPADGWPFLSKEKLQELRESGSRASWAQDIVQIMDCPLGSCVDAIWAFLRNRAHAPASGGTLQPPRQSIKKIRFLLFRTAHVQTLTRIAYMQRMASTARNCAS
jgi:hypothetical protein